MNPEEESQLKAAFSELRGRQRSRAPQFAAMRETALRKANGSPTSAGHRRVVAPLAWIGAACAVALITWRASIPERDSQGEGAEPNLAAEELIASIEHHLQAEQESPAPEYPTDLLLAGNQAAPTP